MKKRILLNSTVIAAILISFLCPLFSNAATYYVDRNHTSASDANPGTLELPWLTIQHAAETAVAGDIVYIRNGTYNEQMYIENNGNAVDGYIVFSAYSSETPIIDGTGVMDTNTGIILARSYIRLVGLEVRNWPETGIWIENAAFIEISDCEVYNVSYGIGVADGTHDFVLNRVEMHHFDLYGFDASPSGGAICYNGTFNDCIAHTGRDPGQNVDGFALGHGNQYNFTFNRCEAYNVFDGFDVGENIGTENPNVLLNRCSGHDCWNDAFKITGQAKMVNCIGYSSVNANVAVYWAEFSGTATLHSCTFFDAETYNVWIENSTDSLHVYNCIIAGCDNIGLGFEQRDASTYKGDNNLFYNDTADRAVSVGYEDDFSMTQIEAGAWTTYSGQDANSRVALSASDIFVNPGIFDLHLLKSSNAIDNGLSVGAPQDDFDGNPRPVGQRYDIGAYEYQGGTDVDDLELKAGNPQAFSLSQNYPNPFNPSTSINYIIPQSANLRESTLIIYNVLGKSVRTLMSGRQPADYYTTYWDGRNDSGVDVTAGIYIYNLTAGSFVASQKMILVR